MDKYYGGQSMYAPLRTVLVRRPDISFAVDDIEAWHYTARPDIAMAQEEHDGLVRVLRQAGAEVIYHDEPLPEMADSIFAFDPAIMTDQGAVILSMGKEQRRGEEAAMARRFEALNIPILYTLHGKARAEGGDLLWLDHETLAVGQGFRTNSRGLHQLREAMAMIGVSVTPVELPYHTGPASCLHLLSLISIVDRNLAVVYLPLLAVPLWQELRRRNFQLIEVPDAEFASMGPNVLALGPRQCLMLEGNPITQRRLEEAGCEVFTYKGDEISHKAEGGATCLTRPILRDNN